MNDLRPATSPTGRSAGPLFEERDITLESDPGEESTFTIRVPHIMGAVIRDNASSSIGKAAGEATYPTDAPHATDGAPAGEGGQATLLN